MKIEKVLLSLLTCICSDVYADCNVPNNFSFQGGSSIATWTQLPSFPLTQCYQNASGDLILLNNSYQYLDRYKISVPEWVEKITFQVFQQSGTMPLTMYLSTSEIGNTSAAQFNPTIKTVNIPKQTGVDASGMPLFTIEQLVTPSNEFMLDSTDKLFQYTYAYNVIDLVAINSKSTPLNVFIQLPTIPDGGLKVSYILQARVGAQASMSQAVQAFVQTSVTPVPALTIAVNNPPNLIQGVPSGITITPTNGILSSCTANSAIITAPLNPATNTLTLNPNAGVDSVAITCTGTKNQPSNTITLPVKPATTLFSSFTLSPSVLDTKDTDKTITVVPNEGAVIPLSVTCDPSPSESLARISATSWKIDPIKTQKAQRITVSCTGVSGKSTFDIVEPLVITPITAFDPSSNSLSLTKLQFKFLPSEVNNATLYIAGYIPELENKLTGKNESVWICREKYNTSWIYMPGYILPDACKQTISTNGDVDIVIDKNSELRTPPSTAKNELLPDLFFRFNEATLKIGKVQLYGAYTTDDGKTFKFVSDTKIKGTFSVQGVNPLYIFK